MRIEGGTPPMDGRGAAAAMPDREFLREHQTEYTYLVGRFMVEHLVRVHRAFEGDIAAAVVLGTIAHYNYRRFYEEVVQHSREPMRDLCARGEHLPLMRPCNAMSVSESTGIPRETVRRKIKWLIARGWVRQEGRDRLCVGPTVGTEFAQFDAEMLEHFNHLLGMLQRARRRTVSDGDANTPAPNGRAPHRLFVEPRGTDPAAD